MNKVVPTTTAKGVFHRAKWTRKQVAAAKPKPARRVTSDTDHQPRTTAEASHAADQRRGSLPYVTASGPGIGPFLRIAGERFYIELAEDGVYLRHPIWS